jgi:hypothetical protein
MPRIMGAGEEVNGMKRTLLLAVSMVLGCTSTGPGGPPAEDYDLHPETPAIERDVAMIDDSMEWTNPFVPGFRTTQDGRIGLRVQGGKPGGERLETMLSFYLFVPEKLEEPIMPGPPGERMLATAESIDLVFPPALEEGIVRFGHHALCDPTTELPTEGERPNPQPCADTPENDCYELTVVSATSKGTSAQVWGIPVTLEVADPKTADARIVNAALGDPTEGMVIQATNELMEPNVTSDGRLMTGRVGRFMRPWTNPATGEEIFRPYDFMYSQLPEGAAPCDVTGWTELHPMSHAPYDPRMVGTYGLAAYPFRDTEGQPIPDGEDMGGTYPWVDREGANVFMTGVHGRLAEQSEEQYPRRCANAGCDEYEENTDFDRGFMVAGLWTHGKLVHLDGMINNIDWAVGVRPETHWMVDLYKNGDGTMAPVRFGAGRFIGRFRGDVFPPGYTDNANILDSLQNLPNQFEHARPVTPRDVVWLMSTGVATDEIAFDDYLDPQALIVSNMQASITQYYDDDGESLSMPHHHNGQVREYSGPIPITAIVELQPEEFTEIHLQNAATTLAFPVPSYGEVEAGTGRTEPVALGGVHGRGFWLSGDNAIRYAVPPQDAAMAERELYVGLFVDPRTTEGASRSLLTFPDRSQLRLVDGARAQYMSPSNVLLHEVELPAGEGFMHLGLRVSEGHQTIELLHDGFPLDRFESDEPLFAIAEGELIVGERKERDAGVRGWIDDFVVLIHDVNPEVACNHASGTLVRVDDNGEWAAVAARYPAWAHEEAAAAAGEPTDATFACFLDLSRDYGAHLQNIPAGTEGMREAINFPEGPIRYGAPRPDSSGNGFCLSCHSAEGKAAMGLDALAFRPGVMAEDDPRRQPMQPPRRVFGNIPAGWLEGGPAEAMVAPPEGVVMDQWVLPHAD